MKKYKNENKSLYFKGKMLNFAKNVNSSLPVNEKMFFFRKRKIDLAKHFSKRSRHCWLIE